MTRRFIYQDAAKYLYIHHLLVEPTDKNYLNGMWGKLACEILTQNWEVALQDLKRLQMFIGISLKGIYFNDSLSPRVDTDWRG